MAAASRNLLAERFIQAFPDHSARVLDQATPEEIRKLPETLSSTAIGTWLSYSSPQTAAELLKTRNKKVESVLPEVPIRNLAPMMRLFDEDLRQEILGCLPAKQAASLKAMMESEPFSVARYARPDILTFSPSTTIGEARKRIENNPGNLQHYLFVVNSNQELQGVCSEKNFFLQKNFKRPLEEIMDLNPAYLRAEDTLENALTVPSWQRWELLPVINRWKQFVGIVSYADLIRGLQGLGKDGSPDILITASKAMGEAFWQVMKLLANAVPEPNAESGKRKEP